VNRRIAFFVVAAWLALILGTHRGAMSPYTYGPEAAHHMPVTRRAAPDALTVLPVTRFFYDATAPHYPTAHNLRLPLHSFSVATVVSFIRPYLLANDVTNLLFLLLVIAAALRLAQRFRLDLRGVLLALLTVCALPPIVGFIGQPMQYIVGPAISYLVILAAMALPDDDLRNPWLAGGLTAILTLNYDWYVFFAALAAYCLFVVRFRTARDRVIYVLLSVVPLIGWNLFLRAVTGGTASVKIQRTFLAEIAGNWMAFLADPAETPLLPVTVTQIGAHIAFHQVIALIHWPLIVCCAIALWRAPLPAFRARHLLLLLVVFYVLEQLFTAAFDWENNPRRALPLFFAFACVYCWAAHRRAMQRGWTITFAVLFGFVSLIAFADVLVRTPSSPTLYMGDAIRNPPRYLLEIQDGRIAVSDVVAEGHEQFLQPFPRARIDAVTLPFVVANAVGLTCIVALLWIAARAQLLPRATPWIAAALWLASGIRFLV
jgi:hypothetical protein